jgi:hypothetical protein
MLRDFFKFWKIIPIINEKDGRMESESLTQSQKKIVEVCDNMKSLLLYKNQKYGDSALNPNNIFIKEILPILLKSDLMTKLVELKIIQMKF